MPPSCVGSVLPALANESHRIGAIMALRPLDPVLVEARDRGMSAEEVVALMHRQGSSIVQACADFTRLYGAGLDKAKVAVTSHPSYRDLAKAHEPLHDELVRYFAKPSDKPPA